MSDFFLRHRLILSEVFSYRKGQESQKKKNFINVQKIILRKLDRRNTFPIFREI